MTWAKFPEQLQGVLGARPRVSGNSAGLVHKRGARGDGEVAPKKK